MPEYGKRTPEEIKMEILKNSLEKNPNVPNVIASAIFNGSDQKIYELSDRELAQLLRTSPKQKIDEFYDDLLLHPEHYNDEYIELVLAPFGFSQDELNVYLQIIRKSISSQTLARMQTKEYSHKSAEDLLQIATTPREPAIVEFTFFHKASLHTVGELAFILEFCSDPKEFVPNESHENELRKKLWLMDSNEWLQERINAIQANMVTRAKKENISRMSRSVTEREVDSYRTYLVGEAERLGVISSPDTP